MTGPDCESNPDAAGVVRAEYDWSSRTPSTAVVETVAIASDRAPATLEPLFYAVDPDALDTLVRSIETLSADGNVTVAFAFAGVDVVVRSDGAVVVGPVGPRPDSE